MFNRKQIIINGISKIIDNRPRHYRNYIKKKYPNIFDFIMRMYSDSSSFAESYYRIINNIEERPRCICGNKLNFANIHKGFSEHCCKSCVQKDKNVKQKIQNSLIQHYGSLEEYHRQRYEKVKQTNFERYGYFYTLQRPDIQEKIKQTTIERYNIPYFNNKEQAKQTCLKKHGVSTYLLTKECKEKFKEKYGVEHYFSLDESIKSNAQYHIDHRDELNKKRRETCMARYNVDNVSKIKEVRNIISQKISNIETQTKINNTKRKNHTFNTSKPEEQTFDILKQKYPDIIRQYRSDKYPFNCDFYVPSLDLYIECNYNWTHGNKPYEGTEEDNEIVNKWKAKNTRFYDNAINTWTIRDVKKRETTRQNNLNWIEFFSILELDKWLYK